MMLYIVVIELKGTPMSVISVRLQAEVEQHLETIAGRLDRSKGWVINQALSEYIETQQRERRYLIPSATWLLGST